MKFTLPGILGLSFCAVSAVAAGRGPSETVLIVVTNHGDLGDTGQETGYFLSEVAHPWKVFRDEGFAVDFASPEGGFAPMDPKSFDLEDPVNREFWHTLDAVEGVADTRPLAKLDPADYAAVFFAGGHGTMWDFPGSEAVRSFTAKLYEGGGVVGGVCHGPAALVDVRLEDGRYLIDGKRLAGFTDEEEAAVGLTDTVPFLLESKLRERGAEFTEAPNFEENVAVDGRLVTGQNPASAEKTARMLVRALRD